MIITRTPYRISFFGGGTDYPAWYREHGGSVLSTTIDKYCYISCRRLPPFFQHKHRIVYSAIENVNCIDDIKHPAVREILRYMSPLDGLEIHHDGDLPARSGLGSSSSFTVGLLQALSALRGEYCSAKEIARRAIYIEQDVIGENVGSQDQIAAATGGFNQIEFKCDDSFEVSPVVIPATRHIELRSHLMLFFTGFSRLASEIAKAQIDNLGSKHIEMEFLRESVNEALAILGSNTPLAEFGNLLAESWKRKRSLSSKVSSPIIDEIYDRALRAGALGGKLLGAGGGGFMLLFVKPCDQPLVRKALKDLVNVPFNFESSGTKVVLYRPDGLE
jgi:D-glycero-alpha-D-manno-heptose-7-phosphate kinase